MNEIYYTALPLLTSVIGEIQLSGKLLTLPPLKLQLYITLWDNNSDNNSDACWVNNRIARYKNACWNVLLMQIHQCEFLSSVREIIDTTRMILADRQELQRTGNYDACSLVNEECCCLRRRIVLFVEVYTPSRWWNKHSRDLGCCSTEKNE